MVAPPMSRGAFLSLVVLGLSPACSEDANPPGESPGGPMGPWKSVILITIDTLRADRLGAYGYDKPTTPNLDALAATSARFERALVPTPRTTPSLASILTGRTPAAHKIRTLLGQRLEQDEITLAERFSDAGFATGAIVSIPFFPNKMGFGQGFGEDFEDFDVGEDVRADKLTDHALSWIDAHKNEPFFLWLHYRDPHAPYYPPARFREKLDPGYDGDLNTFHYWPVDDEGRPLPGTTEAQRTEMKGKLKFGRELPSTETLRRAKALYDGEIAFTDEQVGRLITALDGHGLFDDTVLAVTADHGESLGEHDFWFDHGEFLYDDCLRVPLIVHAPSHAGQRIAPRVIQAQVGVIDIAPTLLHLFGLPEVDNAQGVSFADVILGGPEPRDRDLLAESGEPLMWQENPRFAGLSHPPDDPRMRLRARAPVRDQKAIYDPVDESLEYYRLMDDPAEEHDREGDPTYKGKLRLARRTLEFLPYLDTEVDLRAMMLKLSKEDIQLLVQQGYLAPIPSAGDRPIDDASQDNPK